MKAAVLYEPDTPLRIEEFEVPELGPEHVRVRLVASVVCHSDWRIQAITGGPGAHYALEAIGLSALPFRQSIECTRKRGVTVFVGHRRTARASSSMPAC